MGKSAGEVFRGTASSSYLTRQSRRLGNGETLLSMVVREWLVHHSKRGVWYQLESEEEYIAEVIARFYEATVERHLEIDQLSIALRYLQACLNSTLLEKRRDSTPLPEIPMWERKNSGELAAVDLARTSCGKCSEICFPTRVNSVWPICSFTVL